LKFCGLSHELVDRTRSLDLKHEPKLQQYAIPLEFVQYSAFIENRRYALSMYISFSNCIIDVAHKFIASALFLRGDPRLQKLPPYISLLCIIIGVAWLLLLPLNEYSRRTYVSENALLPGQVHTYFAGSDQNIFRGLKHEVDALGEKSNGESVFMFPEMSIDSFFHRVNDKLEEIFKASGLKVARQQYEYTSSGVKYGGENVYAILHAPRGDATEAIVLVGAWKNMKGELNRSGVPLVLTLARYFKSMGLHALE